MSQNGMIMVQRYDAMVRNDKFMVIRDKYILWNEMFINKMVSGMKRLWGEVTVYHFRPRNLVISLNGFNKAGSRSDIVR